MSTQPSINDIQIGGSHYDKTGEQHWDRAWRLDYDFFQYQVTKYVERWKKKNGLEDLKKAQHFLNKYVEVVEAREKANLVKQVNSLGDFPHISPEYLQKIPDRF